MKAAEKILKITDNLITAIIVVILAVSGAYAVFALWDNHQIYAAAEDVQLKILEKKPDITGGKEKIKESFEELDEVNPDICGWITIDNTEIDYPVLQGENNFSYINTDVYGNFSLSGSIFLDSRNSPDFSDTLSLIYGHHMAGGKMFGDLDKFRNKDFFEKNKTGVLVMPEKVLKLKIVALMTASASDKMIFEPQVLTAENVSAFCGHIKSGSLYYDEAELSRVGKSTRFIALSTCSNDFTNARTVLITKVITD